MQLMLPELVPLGYFYFPSGDILQRLLTEHEALLRKFVEGGYVSLQQWQSQSFVQQSMGSCEYKRRQIPKQSDCAAQGYFLMKAVLLTNECYP
jgi:hypothetical protein